MYVSEVGGDLVIMSKSQFCSNFVTCTYILLKLSGHMIWKFLQRQRTQSDLLEAKWPLILEKIGIMGLKQQSIYWQFLKEQYVKKVSKFFAKLNFSLSSLVILVLNIEAKRLTFLGFSASNNSHNSELRIQYILCTQLFSIHC